MTVPDLDTGDAIVETWVDAVAVDVNDHETRLDLIEEGWTSMQSAGDWTPPALTNVTGGTASGWFKTLGANTFLYEAAITAGTATNTGTISVGLPGAWTLATDAGQFVSAGTTGGVVVGAYTTTTAITLWKDGNGTQFTAGNSVAGYRLKGWLRRP